ncbi:MULTISPECIES: oligopeptide/dipeptide ABC transporter ATP-binding protein [Ramlibacter]|uniref:ATP-binding cassette domain-containing protein n=1 Tax=Ramlibacter aquaticus TaxID=2780094 RepID=A0ABR9SHF5_9BURK|nr:MULTISPECIES: oligopeptide/dipeptide ABC transporter ATP-binding protein [Ramlibacter]MBE7941314.1 ATP-binding cassette domain-containing protein [Ramlibacter aquaticus]
MNADAPLLAVRDLHVEFSVRGEGLLAPRRTLRAVNGVSFEIRPGETLGIVGESGCGKSTLARAILNLVPSQSGSIAWMGQEMRGAGASQWQAVRRHAQMVFQDPLASLNPRMNVAQIVGEPLRTHRPELSAAQVRERVAAMLDRVGLGAAHLNRYPHEFSGGQCQRIGIARALILEPRLVVCDEPVSALDVSIQAQIINLLQDLQQEMGLALVFIAHDLAVVRHVSQRILVMYLGRVMELAAKEALYSQPRHPYTQALLASVPIPDPRLERAKKVQLLQGELPSPLALPGGCVFRTRCPRAFDKCAAEVPPLAAVDAQSRAACWLYE